MLALPEGKTLTRLLANVQEETKEEEERDNKPGTFQHPFICINQYFSKALESS